MLDDLRARLSEDLRATFDLEIGRGNPVAEELIDAWEFCPYQIVFQNPLDLQAALDLNLAPTVKQYVEKDPHYPAFAGFISESSRHSLAPPHPHGKVR